MDYHDRRPELLAPVGSKESLKAAIQNGCDAVYLGGKAFGARAYAANFTFKEIQEALDYAHFFGVRVYVTVNTLYKDSELTALFAFIQELANAGVDGIILQDLGVAWQVRKLFPHVELHASTQMTIHNLPAVLGLEKMGFERVVLARELSLAEISEIEKGSSMEIETFIHGALCICYSGQCLMSSFIGGRSGNRGRCAQPCRLPYSIVQLESGEKIEIDGMGPYLLSPKDISTLEILPQLIQAGISSFKMEGRMKRPEYVAAVTQIYRKYLDLAFERPAEYHLDPGDRENLAQLFNRGGFHPGYYLGKRQEEMMSDVRAKNWGVLIGKVLQYDPERQLCTVQLTKELEPGDGIEIWTKSGTHPGTQVHSLKKDGNRVRFAIKGSIHPGDLVYRTSQKRLLEALAVSYTGSPRKIEVFGRIELEIDKPIQLHLWDERGIYIQQSGDLAEKARKHPLSSEQISEQIFKLGDFPLELVSLEVEMSGEIFVPVSRLNALRREAAQKFEQARIRYFRKERPDNKLDLQQYLSQLQSQDTVPTNHHQEYTPLLTVALRGSHLEPEKFIQAEIQRLYVDIQQMNREKIGTLRETGLTEIYLSLPRISRDHELFDIQKQIESLGDLADGFLVGNLGQLTCVQETQKPYVVDFSLNCFNFLSLRYWKEMGAKSVTLSPELTIHEIKEILQSVPMSSELMAYGYLPAMISEYCPLNPLKKSGICSKETMGLLDRKGMIFPVLRNCSECRSTILNSQPLVVVDRLMEMSQLPDVNLRMELTIETEEIALDLIALYQEVLHNPHKDLAVSQKNRLEKLQRKGFTRGHFFRGVE